MPREYIPDSFQGNVQVFLFPIYPDKLAVEASTHYARRAAPTEGVKDYITGI
jgi:hypothetical protein